MVSFIYFMKPLLSFVFAKLIIGVRGKWILALMFSATSAFLSAFLDALTVMAVLIAVFGSLYGVYERIHLAQNTDYDQDAVPDREELGGDSLENFRSFIRSLIMHGAVGTALGGVGPFLSSPNSTRCSIKPECPLNWAMIAGAMRSWCGLVKRQAALKLESSFTPRISDSQDH